MAQQPGQEGEIGLALQFRCQLLAPASDDAAGKVVFVKLGRLVDARTTIDAGAGKTGGDLAAAAGSGGSIDGPHGRVVDHNAEMGADGADPVMGMGHDVLVTQDEGSTVVKEPIDHRQGALNVTEAPLERPVRSARAKAFHGRQAVARVAQGGDVADVALLDLPEVHGPGSCDLTMATVRLSSRA